MKNLNVTNEVANKLEKLLLATNKIAELEIKKQEQKKKYFKAKNENTGNHIYYLFQYNEYKKQIEKLYSSIQKQIVSDLLSSL